MMPKSLRRVGGQLVTYASIDLGIGLILLAALLPALAAHNDDGQVESRLITMGSERELEDGAPRLIHRDPQSSSMSRNDRPTDGQTHA